MDTPCPPAAPAQQEAAEWCAVLSSGEVSDQEKSDWQAWLTVHA